MDSPAEGLIELRVAELSQLFNQMDPSPFRERDLDPRAEEFIVGWAEEKPANVPIVLLVHCEHEPAADVAELRDAIRQFFRARSDNARRELRMLFRRGRMSLAIAIAFLAATIFAGDLVSTAMDDSRFAGILAEGLLIGGWVAMWRPLEVFLYDWWPIRSRRRLYDRLGNLSLEIRAKPHQPQ